MDCNECCVCHQNNDQLLILSCGHDPCIDCAATNYFKRAQFRKQFTLIKQANYWCEICYQATTIEQSSIIELLNYYSKKTKLTKTAVESQSLKRSKSHRQRNLSKNSKQPQSPYHDPYKNIRSKQKNRKDYKKQFQQFVQKLSSKQMKSTKVLPHSQYHNEMQASIKGVKMSKNLLLQSQQYNSNPCKKHADQLLTYYCFTCNVSVCVQCALHGSHIGHKVQAIKKAGNRLKTIYESLLQQSQKYRTILQNNIRQLQKTITYFRNWNQKHSLIIKQKFTQLYQLLTQKQQSLLNQIKIIQQQGLNILYIQRNKIENQLTDLKLHRKKLKYGINIQPMYWNIGQMQNIKKQIRNIIQKNFSFNNNIKIGNQVKFVQTVLLTQAIDIIQELLQTFKVGYHKQQQQSLQN